MPDQVKATATVKSLAYSLAVAAYQACPTAHNEMLMIAAKKAWDDEKEAARSTGRTPIEGQPDQRNPGRYSDDDDDNY